jgi:hypothetical protein
MFIFRKRRKRKMYRILLKMKKMYNHENWMKMVEQAKERGKLTDKEYQELISLPEENK